MCGYSNYFVFHCASRRKGSRLQSELERDGFAAYKVDGASIINEETLLEQFKARVPLEDCGDVICFSWDGFIDCLGGGLQDVPSDKVAILITSADRLANFHLPLLLKLVEIVSDEARLLQSQHPGVLHRICLKVFLLGEGPSFSDCNP